MTVQFIYPDLDIASNSGVWVNNDAGHSPLFSTVDEGVASPNDSDYIQQSGFPVPDTATLSLGMDSVQVVPTDAIFRYRVKNPSGEIVDVAPTLKDIAGNTLITFPSVEVSGNESFRDYEADFSAIVGDGDWGNPLLTLEHSENTPVSGIQNLQISATEIELSGTVDYLSAGMNLFLSVREQPYLSGSIPLFVFTSSESGVDAIFNTTTLYLNGDITSSGSMNLFITGEPVPVSDTSNMNLYLQSDNSITNSIPLFIKNNTLFDSGFISLFMQGQTLGTSGAVPMSGTMPLFISRSSEALERRIPLYIQAPSGDNSAMTLFLEGQPNDRNEMTLYLDARAQPDTSTIRLFVHGF